MKSISIFFKKISSNKYNNLLVLLIVFHICFFVVFRLLDKNYQTWDSAGHISLSYRIANEMKRLILKEEKASLVSILKVSDYYPPFVQIIGAMISLVLGYKSLYLLTEILFFFILSIVFTYKLTLVVTKNPKISFLTTVIYSLFPQIIDQSHYFHLDIPLLSLILVSLYFLYLSEGFKKLKYAILFFVFFGLVQVTKWYGFVFIIVPVVYMVLNNLMNRLLSGTEKVKILKNILFGSLLFLVIVLPWYVENWSTLLSSSKIFSFGESDDPTNLIQAILYYPSNVITYQIMFIPSVLLVISIVHEIVSNKKKGLFIILSLLVPWIVFVCISNKNLRYILPLTPMFAYLISSLTVKISDKIRFAPYLIVLYLLLASSFLSFNRFKKESKYLRSMSLLFAGINYEHWYYSDPTFYSYKPEKFPLDEILSFIYSDANRIRNSVGVAVLVDSNEMSVATFEMVRLENHYDNMYMPVPYFQFQPFKNDAEIEAFFIDTVSEYVISPSNPGPKGLRNYTALMQCIEYLESSRNRLFKGIKTFTLPNGEKITVYRRIDFSENKDMTEGCKQDAGIIDGVETIKLMPGYTYILHTGHFAIEDKVSGGYKKGVIYVVQITNSTYEGDLQIYNLPKSGSSLCVKKGLDFDPIEDVKRPLNLDDQCGKEVPCVKSVLVTWNVGDSEAKVLEYSRDSFK